MPKGQYDRSYADSIRWTDEERSRLMGEYHHLHEYDARGRTTTDIMRLAQLVLPIERRVAIIKPNRIHLWNKAYKHAVDSGHIPTRPPPLPPRDPPAPQTAPPAIESAPTAAPAEFSPPTASRLEPDFILVERKIFIKEQPDYGRIPTITLIRLLSERLLYQEELANKLLGLKETVLRQREQERHYDRRIDPRAPEEKPKEEPLRIIIIGPMPAQQHEITERTAGIDRPLRLSFYGSDHGPKEMPSIIDHAIVMKFANHSWTAKVRAALPADCVTFLDGGVGAVIQKIFDLASQHAPVTHHGTTHLVPLTQAAQ